MAYEIIYTCDNCKQVIENQQQVWNIAIAFRAQPSSPSFSDDSRFKAQWCRLCMEKLHLLTPADHKAAGKLAELPPEPTLAEKIAAIMGELVDSRLDERGVGQ